MLASSKVLIDFEKDIKAIYENGEIHSPIHLSGGNENQLIDIFKNYKCGDWIFTTYRNHYHWILSGRNHDILKKQILNNKSMHVSDYKFIVSSIVAGQVPIALGVSLALKLKKQKNKVFCFMGDAAANCGLSTECFRYATGHDLPITFVIEDNGKSVIADTAKTWGLKNAHVVKRYKYKRKYPHHGTGKYILF
jgi:pyruvate dehydrogenase E1 component alpha subunit